MKISARGLQIRSLSALCGIWISAVSVCCSVLYDLAGVLSVIRLKAFTGLRHWGSSLNCHHRWIAGLMKCLVCILLAGLYFTSFEMTVAPPSGRNYKRTSHSGPSLPPLTVWDTTTWQNWSISFIISSVTLSVDGVSLSLSIGLHFDFSIELVNLQSEVVSQLASLCFQCWCKKSILNREHFHVQGNVSHLHTHTETHTLVVVVIIILK